MSNIFGNAKNLGFGLMRLPVNNPNDDADVDIATLKNMVDLFLERGFTYFDTALMYNGSKSEDAIREALVERHPRESFTLTDKLHYAYLHEEADCDRVFEGQRKRTGVEYFDYYLVHDINVESIEVYERLHVFDWIMEKKAAGLVKHIGFSFHDSPQLLDKVLSEHPEMEFVQIQLNYLDYDSPAIKSRECYETAVRHNRPVIIMEPVKGGTLVNVPQVIADRFKSYNPQASTASWAIRFAASHENVRMVLSGMSNMAQLEDNTGYMSDFKPLCEEEKSIIEWASQKLKESTAIPCTGCSYCTGGCPKGIPIPKYFALYNGQKREDPNGTKGWTPQVEYYGNLTLNFPKAGECLQCRQCEEICPQHLEITSYLKQVSALFDRG